MQGTPLEPRQEGTPAPPSLVGRKGKTYPGPSHEWEGSSKKESESQEIPGQETALPAPPHIQS